MRNALLLGAGFSFDLGMPTAFELTEVFLSLFDEENTKRLSAILASQCPYGADRPINKKAITESFNLLLDYKRSTKGSNYEELLSQLQDMGEKFDKSLSDKDSYNFVFGLFYEIIHTILSIYQEASYNILYLRNKKWFSKLENLLTDCETWVFSLNHDLFFECLSIDFSMPITYGDIDTIQFPVSNIEFDKKISLTCAERVSYNAVNGGFIKNRRGFNLVKLHGGLSELEYKDGTIICNLDLKKNSSLDLMKDFRNVQRMGYYEKGIRVLTSRDKFITNSKGELDIVMKSMLTGGRKYSKTAKIKDGEEKLKVFDDVLNQIDLLTIIGYGFGDKHINFRISNAMARRNELSVQIIDPVQRKLPDFLEPFDYDGRVKKAMCGAAHWLDYCKSKKWDAEQIAGLKENVKYRNEVRSIVDAVLRNNFIDKSL